MAKLRFSQSTSVVSGCVYFVGVLSALLGIIILSILTGFGEEWYSLLIGCIALVPIIFIWGVILASKDEGAPILRDFRQGMNSWQGKSLVYILILLESCFIVQWDTQKTILDPLMFAAFLLSWSCALRCLKLHKDNEIQLALATATSFRALSLYSLASITTWSFFLYSVILGLLRFYFESRDVESPPRNDVKK